MIATGVHTPSIDLEWLRHMESHGPMALYDCWTWEVHCLRFNVDPEEPPVPERDVNADIQSDD